MNSDALKSVERLFGLIGYPLSHSFSKKYFSEKFEKEQISGCYYDLFPLENISQFPNLLKAYPNLAGLNVTIPYKEQVIPFLDDLNDGAAAVQAVNTIKVSNGQLTGYNTDVFGFEQSLLRGLSAKGLRPGKALILGTGGAAKAVAYVLGKLGIAYQYVSRSEKEGAIRYAQLDREIITSHTLIINTTPLGMSPNVGSFPDIPYHYMTNKHFAFDLVYNPQETTFLAKAKEQDAATQNGLEMLQLQAEKAWEIWND